MTYQPNTHCLNFYIFIMCHLKYFCFLCVLFISVFHNAQALELGDERVRLSGFGTFGLTHAGTDQVGYRKELSHAGQFGGVSVRQDSVFGLQLDADLSSNVRATIQAVIEERAKYDFENIVDWAYLSYQATPSLVVRGGRMVIDLFMLSEYRNVTFAYLWTHPIVEFYGPLPFTHFDGADIKYTYQMQSGNLDFKVFGGHMHSDIKVFGGRNHLGFLPIVGANTTFESMHWKVRLSAATAELDSFKSPVDSLLYALEQTPVSIWPETSGFINKLNGDKKQVSFLSAGLAYDKNSWLFQSEAALAASKWPAASMYTGYASLGRRFGPVTFYSVVSGAKTLDRKTTVTSPILPLPQLEVLQTVTQDALNAGRINQQTVSVGARWDIHPQVALKAQWDHTWIRRHGGVLLQNELLDRDITLNIFSANISFVF